MTDTTTVDTGAQAGGEQLEEMHESPVLGGEGHDADDPIKTRLVLPLLLPLLSIAAIAVYVLNISRVFLAGDKTGSLVLGIIVTLTILVGATVVAAVPRLRTSSLALVLGLGLVIVVGAGAIALGPSLNEGEGGSAAAGLVGVSGPATGGTVSVTAGPGLSFGGVKFTSNFTAKTGVVQIKYGGDAGHTLAIDSPQYASFLLGTDAGTKHAENVKFDKPGTYTIYCTVPGHEAAGMKATITVQ